MHSTLALLTFSLLEDVTTEPITTITVSLPNLIGQVISLAENALTVCQRSHCSHRCTEVAGEPICSCPDERMYLSSDGKNCGKYGFFYSYLN